MKKFIILYILLIGFTFIFSCKRKNSTSTTKQFSDSCLVIEKNKVAVFYQPDSLEIVEMQKVDGVENTEIAMDDVNYYNYVADTLLKHKGFSTLYSSKKCLLFKYNNKEYAFNRKKDQDESWEIVLFDGQELRAMYAIDIEEKLKNIK